MKVQPSQPKVIKICTDCFTTIYPGCRHSCSTQRYRHKKLENLEKLISSPTTSERLASRAISRCDDEAGLMTYGPKRKLINPNPRRQLFSVDDMCLIRKDINLSARDTLCLAQHLRNSADCEPRSVIEPRH